jgi:hypothetical protein
MMRGAQFTSRRLDQVRPITVLVSALLIGAAGSVALSPAAAGQPTTVPGDGTYVVGRDIQPGTYSTSGGLFCYWERLSGLSGEFDDVIADDFAEGQGYVTIEPTDVAFETSDCPEWTVATGIAD